MTATCHASPIAFTFSPDVLGLIVGEQPALRLDHVKFVAARWIQDVLRGWGHRTEHPADIQRTRNLRTADDAAPTFVRDLQRHLPRWLISHFHLTASLPAERPWPTWKQVEPDLVTTSASRLCPDANRLRDWCPGRTFAFPPLDATKPLWEAHIGIGVGGQPICLLLQEHHCATDGYGLR